jgi:hypothetical protein
VQLSPQITKAIGQILAVSYPVLALSAGVRATYQLCCKPGVVDKLPPTLSAVAALCYLLITLGFVVRKPWTWWLAVGLLVFELAGVLVVGTLSLLSPGLIGRTVWHHFGLDYGFLPLVQPVLGLVWLYWGENKRQYGLGARHSHLN